MDLSERLRVVEAAQQDPVKLALATVDLAYPALPEAGRIALRDSLEVAAIPHWCDPAILAALLEVPQSEGEARLSRLRELSIAESFPARGKTAINVHEATRLVLRKSMAENEPTRFRALSGRAAVWFAEDSTLAGKIERLYHLLSWDPVRGASELSEMDRSWTAGGGGPEERYALAAALSELEDNGLVQGRVRIWTLLVTAWTRVSRGESAQLADVARDTLRLAQAEVDPRAEADANRLLGDALQAQGQLAAALAAFEKLLAISQRLAPHYPDDVGWRWKLAVAHSRVGGVLMAQGKLGSARSAINDYLSISRQLAAKHPGDGDLQRELAVAYGQVGDVLQAQGRLAPAEAAFARDLAISQQLAKQNPGNADWQREVAVAHSRIADVLLARGNVAEAGVAYRAGLEINQELVVRDRSNADWQRELAVAHGKMGDVLQAQGKTVKAQAEFVKSLAILRRLASQDPRNADFQRELAGAHSRLGDWLLARGKLVEAEARYREDLTISRRLAAQDPGNAILQKELAVAHSRIGEVLQARGNMMAARTAIEEYLAISQRLAAQDPDNLTWQRELAVAQANLGEVSQAVAETAIRESFAINQRLAAQDTDNLGWQRELAVAWAKLAELEFRNGRYGAALRLYDEARRIFTTLAKEAPGLVQWTKDKKIVDSRLAICRSRVRASRRKPRR